MDLFPPKLRRLWNEWEIRTLIVISLTIQVFLILFGSHRKHSNSKWIAIPLWLGYLLADWAATLALGVLASSKGYSDCNTNSGGLITNLNNELLAFWAPFLLLHLGGPDTITAFSIEDNELWLRHLFGLISHVSIAVYVMITSTRRVTHLLPANILILIAGVIKYSERTVSLMLGSRENFRDAMVHAPDPGPNYARFMEEYHWKTTSGAKTKIVWDNESVSETQLQVPPIHTNEQEDGKQVANGIQIQILSKSYEFFEIFKRLIVDLILTFQDRNQSQSFFETISWRDAYTMIEKELVFVYEVLYTKAAVINTLPGRIFHVSNILLILSSFTIFLLLVEKHPYNKTDVIITYVLLVGAVILELWSITRLVLSDWTIIWLSKKKHDSFSSLLLKVKSRIPSKAWSNSMAQYSLINFCLKDEPTYLIRLMKCIHCKDKYDKYHYRTYTLVTNELKEFIFKDLKGKLEATDGSIESYNRAFGTSKGKLALETLGISKYYKEIYRSVEVELDETILQWHIATDICFHVDTKKVGSDSPTVRQKQKISMEVSKYMLYLLISRPFMLRAGIGQIRYLDTCAEAKKFFNQNKTETDQGRACRRLFFSNTDIPPKQVKGDASKSVLFDASRLAKSLEKLDMEKRWDLMSHIWADMLYYVASNCRGIYHAQRLSNGGELLTVVWFLMAHLGIGEQYRVEAGNVRAKYTVEN